MISLFGFAREYSPLKNNAYGSAHALKEWGVDSVFCGTQDKEMLQALREAGIKIFVEKAIFSDASLFAARPDSRPVDENGKRVEPEDWYKPLCPGQDWLRRLKLHELKQTAESGEVDGIWLDFMRYPCHWEGAEPTIYQSCFCQECLLKFQKHSEVKLPGNLSDPRTIADWILSEYPGMWQDFRCEMITSFVGRVRQLIEDIRPEMTLGLFSVPWMEQEHNRAMQRIIAQDLKALAEHVDVFSPMTYHQMCDKTVSWIGEVTEEVAKLTGKPVVPIIQSMSTADELSRDEFHEALETALAGASDGLIIFNMKGLLDEKRLADFIGVVAGQKADG